MKIIVLAFLILGTLSFIITNQNQIQGNEIEERKLDDSELENPYLKFIESKFLKVNQEVNEDEELKKMLQLTIKYNQLNDDSFKKMKIN